LHTDILSYQADFYGFLCLGNVNILHLVFIAMDATAPKCFDDVENKAASRLRKPDLPSGDSRAARCTGQLFHLETVRNQLFH
jgi:hypothetical protein